MKHQGFAVDIKTGLEAKEVKQQLYEFLCKQFGEENVDICWEYEQEPE